MAVSSPPEKHFADRLREARELRKMSQSELAEKTGFQASAISHFETARRAPSFDNLKRLADALNVSVDYLLGREDKSESSGPLAQQLFRDFSKMSEADQENLAKIAEMLADKNKKRRG